MECAICYSIVHPSCVPPGGSAPSEDLPNSWECPQCTNMGLNHDYKVYISFQVHLFLNK